jgi:hypothetical protein
VRRQRGPDGRNAALDCFASLAMTDRGLLIYFWASPKLEAMMFAR